VFRVATLICPSVFYILAAQKERLMSLKQTCRIKSNQVTVMEMKGGPADDGTGPTNHDPGNCDQVEAAAGQSSGERQDRSGSTSQAVVRHRGQAVVLDPSLLPNNVIKEGDSAV
jgi:hypothetical protein